MNNLLGTVMAMLAAAIQATAAAVSMVGLVFVAVIVFAPLVCILLAMIALL